MYNLNDTHPEYGTVQALLFLYDQDYRLLDKNGTASLVPLKILEKEDDRRIQDRHSNGFPEGFA